MTYYVIPARKGSKGFPLKNRVLLNYTLQTIPEKELKKVIISTDDDYIIENSPKECIKIKREEKYSNDEASTTDVLKDVVKKLGLKKDDRIVLLYLTYPTRQFLEVLNAESLFNLHQAKSLLCKKKVKTHPYLCIYEDGTQVVKHNLCRRQDYPEVWEICHYIGIFKVSELKKLNRNLYNKDTYFMEIEEPVDVDYKEDFLRV